MIVVLIIACAVLAIGWHRTWMEKEHWYKLYEAEWRKGNPGTWYCGKDGVWIEGDS